MVRCVPGELRPYGATVRRFFVAVVAHYGSTCHLCGRPGADTVDHLVPTSVDPSLRWEMSNVRPAHFSCNSSRKDRALAGEFYAAGW